MIFAGIRNIRHTRLRRLAIIWLPLGQLWRWVTRRLGGTITVKHRIGPYGPFRLDGYFAFSNFAAWGSNHNDGFLACVEASRGRRCVIDVGAHIGLVSLPMASVLAPGGKVIAFEPARANRTFLEQHIALNNFGDRVRVEALLVADQECDAVDFFEFRQAAGKNTMVPGILDDNAIQFALRQTSLDVYCEQNEIVPEVIKIDVEGAELFVLSGMKRILEKFRPVVFLSVHPRQIAASGRSADEIGRILDEIDYDCSHVDGSPVSSFALREYVLRSRS